MNYQFLTYAESKGHDVANMTSQEIDALKQALLLGELSLPYVELMTNMKLIGLKDKISVKLYDLDFYPGAKVSPIPLIQSLGSAGKISPDTVLGSEILVNNGVNSCGFMKYNDVYCPTGWSPAQIRKFDSNRKEGYYCFKNAGFSQGNVDLCPAAGGQRIWFPANHVYKDLFALLRNTRNKRSIGIR